MLASSTQEKNKSEKVDRKSDRQKIGIILGRKPWKSSEKPKTAEKPKRNKINVLLPNDITRGITFLLLLKM